MKLSKFATALCGLCLAPALPATGFNPPDDFARTTSYTEANAPEFIPTQESTPVPADGKLPSFSLHEGEFRLFHLDRPVGPGELRLSGHGGNGTVQWSISGESGEPYLFSPEAQAVHNVQIVWGWQWNERPERLYFVFEGGPDGVENAQLSVLSRFGLLP